MDAGHLKQYLSLQGSVVFLLRVLQSTNTTLEGEAGEAGDFMKIYERPRIICINHRSSPWPMPADARALALEYVCHCRQPPLSFSTPRIRSIGPVCLSKSIHKNNKLSSGWTVGDSGQDITKWHSHSHSSLFQVQIMYHWFAVPWRCLGCAMCALRCCASISDARPGDT